MSHPHHSSSADVQRIDAVTGSTSAGSYILAVQAGSVNRQTDPCKIHIGGAVVASVEIDAYTVIAVKIARPLSGIISDVYPDILAFSPSAGNSDAGQSCCARSAVAVRYRAGVQLCPACLRRHWSGVHSCGISHIVSDPQKIVDD